MSMTIQILILAAIGIAYALLLRSIRDRDIRAMTDDDLYDADEKAGYGNNCYSCERIRRRDAVAARLKEWV